jgi:hypothetical protein
VPFHAARIAKTWPDAALYLGSLAPRQAPRDLVSNADVRMLSETRTAADMAPFRNLGSGTGFPARSARPRNHPQAVPEVVLQRAFHNDRAESARYGGLWQPSPDRRPYRVPSRESRGHDQMAARSKRPAGWSLVAGIGRTRSPGVAVQPVSRLASQPFLSAPGLGLPAPM